MQHRCGRFLAKEYVNEAKTIRMWGVCFLGVGNYLN